MNNSTITTYYPLSNYNEGQIAFDILLLVFILVPVIAANILILVTLVYESKVNTVIRLMLGNIPIACIIESLGHMMLRISALVIGINRIYHPPDFLCSFSIFMVTLGGIGRIMYMATFSVTVFLVVKIGKDRLHYKYFIPAVICIWVFVFLIAGQNLIEAVVSVEYSFGFICRPKNDLNAKNYVVVVLLFLFAYFLPLLVTVACILKVYRFVKKKVVADKMAVSKSMTKFAIFLIVGNTTNVLANSITIGTLLLSRKEQYEEFGYNVAIAILYFDTVVAHLALIPSCILIINYFKPLRKRIKHYMLTFFMTCLLKKKPLNSMYPSQDLNPSVIKA